MRHIQLAASLALLLFSTCSTPITAKPENQPVTDYSTEFRELDSFYQQIKTHGRTLSHLDMNSNGETWSSIKATGNIIFVIDTSGSMRLDTSSPFIVGPLLEEYILAIKRFTKSIDDLENLIVLSNDGDRIGIWSKSPEQSVDSFRDECAESITDQLMLQNLDSKSSPKKGVSRALKIVRKKQGGEPWHLIIFGDEFDDSIRSFLRLSKLCSNNNSITSINAVNAGLIAKRFNYNVWDEEILSNETRSIYLLGMRFEVLFRFICEENGGQFYTVLPK